MVRFPLLLPLALVALATVPAAVPSAAADVLGSSVVKPYLFNPPDRPTNPLDQQKALIYRDQLRTQQRDLETHSTERLPPPGAGRGLRDVDRLPLGVDRSPLGAERLRETRQELYRMDNIINDHPPVQTEIAPPPVPQQRVPADNSLSLGSGRPQPTPAEVERREAERDATGKAPPLIQPRAPADTERRLAEARAAGRLPPSAPELESVTVPAPASSGPKFDLFGRRIQ